MRFKRLSIVLVILGITAANAHEIYTGVRDKDGHLCCGGADCSVTVYRELPGGRFEFLTREGAWIPIPIERITFLPIPGDENDGTPNKAHLCYRNPFASESIGDGFFAADDGTQRILLYCAFIPPGAT